MSKTIAKNFNCTLINKPVVVNLTYQDTGGLGSNEDLVLVKRDCQRVRQCALSGLYEKCPLKVLPFE